MLFTLFVELFGAVRVFFLLLSFLSCFFLKDSTNRKFFGQHVLFLVFISTYPQIVILAGMGF